MEKETAPQFPANLTEQMSYYRIPLVLFIVSLVCIVLAVGLIAKSATPSEPIQFMSASSSGSLSAEIMVDVAGAVNRPGVYSLVSGSRVEDALVKAGGFASDADSIWIEKSLNRSAFVRDGQKMYIPRTGEISTSHNDTTSIAGASDTSHNIDPLLRQGDQSQNGSVSISNASQAELEELPGIGPVTAQKIIAGRPYISIQELVEKKIVGKSVFEKIQRHIGL